MFHSTWRRALSRVLRRLVGSSSDRSRWARASSHELGKSSDAHRSGRDSGRAVWAGELEDTNEVVLCGATRMDSSLDVWKACVS